MNYDHLTIDEIKEKLKEHYQYGGSKKERKALEEALARKIKEESENGNKNS
jgi:hypothetical protein